MQQIIIINPKFETGYIMMTSGVAALAKENPDFQSFLQKSLNRHVQCDWAM